MDDQISPFPPCPKCGDEQRRGVVGAAVGLRWEYKSLTDVIVCFSCGYLEFYARPETLEYIKDSIIRGGGISAIDFEKSWAEAKAKKEEAEQTE